MAAFNRVFGGYVGCLLVASAVAACLTNLLVYLLSDQAHGSPMVLAFLLIPAFLGAFIVGFQFSLIPMVVGILAAEYFRIRNVRFYVALSFVPSLMFLCESHSQSKVSDACVVLSASLAGCVFYWWISGQRAGEP